MPLVSHIRRFTGFPLMVAVLLFSIGQAAWAAPRLALAPHHVPKAVTKLQPTGRMPASQKLDLVIGLPLRNQDSLSNLLEKLYDPASANYHQFLEPQQFTEQFGPTPQDYQALQDFALTNGLTVKRTHLNRAVLVVSGSVSNIEQAFHVALRTYQHPHENRIFYAPDVEPTLDFNVPVLTVGGLDDYIVPKPMSLHKMAAASLANAPMATGSGPAGGFIGNDFRNAYLPGVTLTGTGQSIAMVEFDDYYTSDITAYKQLAGLPNVPLTRVWPDGFMSPGQDNVEVALDIEVAIALAPGLSRIYVYEGLYPNDILSRIASDNVAKQISASWTYSENATTDSLFQQFAAQGQSFFNASGDSDAYTGGSPPAPPTDNPNITSVGGTTLTTTGPGGSYVTESVWNWLTTGNGSSGSSGGVSVKWGLPTWQAGISMTANQGSTTARNIPDVAFTGDNVFVYENNGQHGLVGGTSCAAPLWAAFTALVNQQSKKFGRSYVGFLNPALYSIGKSSSYTNNFHDITTGNNTNSISPNAFNAVAGYDLCTGWGTPNGAAMISALTGGSILITGQPTNFDALAGGSATFAVTAVGSAMTYQWRFNGTNISLATNSSYILTNAQAANQGTYAVLVSNSVGSVLSSNATLSIHGPPVITSQPLAHSLVTGNTATFSVTANSSTPLGYQWSYNSSLVTGNGNVTGFNQSNLGGATNASLVFANVQASNAGYYQVLVTNAYGTATSSIVSLNVLGTPVSFVGGHGGAQYANGQFTLQLTGLTGQGPIVIQSSSNLVNWISIYTNPAAFGHLQIIDTNASNSSANYYRAVTPAAP